MKKFLSLLLMVAFFSSNALSAISATKTEENNYIRAERKTRHLHSRLSKKYAGYEYTIKNIYNEPVTLKSIAVWDNANDKVAYLSVKRTGLKAAAETVGAGAAMALPTLGLSLIGSIVAVPFIIAGNQIGNIGANQEAQRYDKIPSEFVELKSGEEFTVKTMALHRHAPSMRIIFVNPITDETMNLEL